MIIANNFTKEWLERQLNDIQKRKVSADPLLIEKNIHALHLLEKLIEIKLDFVFKGGTALILLLEEPVRFSIDIDILMNPSYQSDSLDSILKILVSESGPFIKLEEDERLNREIPKKHFKFYYESVVSNKHPQYVLLDILFDNSTYTETEKVPIKNSLINTCDPHMEALCPTLNSLLGEKMTAFAPNTTGIPYSSGKHTEIIKQMFDVSRMIKHIKPDSLGIVKENFYLSADQNIRFRSLVGVEPEHVLEDIIDTSITILAQGKYKEDEYTQLNEGIKRIKGYIHSEKYNYDYAVKDAGRVAHLATTILNNIPFIQYSQELEVKDYTQDEHLRRMNILKKVDKEAYYHWQQVLTNRSNINYDTE